MSEQNTQATPTNEEAKTETTKEETKTTETASA